MEPCLIYKYDSIIKNKLKCCEFKGKQASKIESTSLCCRSYSVLHVIDQKNEWSVFVKLKVSGQTVMPQCLSSA